MKVKNLLLVLCSIFILWSCDETIFLNVASDNSIESENGIFNATLVNNTSTDRYSPLHLILYDVHFDSKTTTFTLFYLPKNVWDMLFSNASVDNTSGVRTGGQLYFPTIATTTLLPDEKPVEQPIPTTKYGPGNALTFKVDIYVTDSNKIIYPPIYLPFFDKAILPETSTQETTCPINDTYETYSSENDIDNTRTTNDLLLNYKLTSRDNSNNVVIANIVNGYIHFQLKHTSSFFSSNVSKIDMGTYDMIYYQTDWLGPDYNINHVYSMYKLGLLICIDLSLIKGDPPMTPIPNDIHPVYISDMIYNIIVSGKTIYLKKTMDSFDTESTREQFVYHNSSYCINSDGSISILDSINGKEIAKYPKEYNIIHCNKEEEQYTSHT